MKIFVVGLGPGEENQMTTMAMEALEQSQVIIGYTVYVDLIKDKFSHKKLMSTPMKKEVDRCQMVLEEALKEQTLSLIHI